MTVGWAMIAVAVILIAGAGWLLRSLDRGIVRGQPHTLRAGVGRWGVWVERQVDPQNGSFDGADEATRDDCP